jgi:hypothetical protein
MLNEQTMKSMQLFGTKTQSVWGGGETLFLIVGGTGMCLYDHYLKCQLADSPRAH